jgi:hypothetical protein
LHPEHAAPNKTGEPKYDAGPKEAKATVEPRAMVSRSDEVKENNKQGGTFVESYTKYFRGFNSNKIPVSLREALPMKSKVYSLSS